MLVVLALWVILSALLGLWARTRGRSGLSWFLIGALVSPLIGAILLISLRDLALEGSVRPRRKHRYLRTLLNMVMAVLVILIFISAMNRGGMKPIHLAVQNPDAPRAAGVSPATATGSNARLEVG